MYTQPQLTEAGYTSTRFAAGGLASRLGKNSWKIHFSDLLD